MKRAFPAMLVAVLLVAGCTPVERSAYNVVVAAKSFLDSEKAAHPECVSPESNVTSAICTDITKAVGAKDSLINALEVYCAGPQFESGGACQAPAKGTAAYDQAASKLQAAISSYNQIAADLKAATK